MDKSILIVEDDKLTLDVLSFRVKKEGYKVLKAANGEKGLAMALSDQPDLILLDLQLPKLKGQDLLVKLRQSKYGKKVPVIILTNDQSLESVEKTLKRAAPAYFVKAETNLTSVVEAIEYHLK